jgi:hypothetical protein
MTDTEARIARLEERIRGIEAEADECVADLLVADGAGLFVAERLWRLGTLIGPALLRLITDRTAPRSPRVLAAVVALRLGERGPALELALDEVRRNGEHGVFAAQMIAVDEAVDSLVLTAGITAALRAPAPRPDPDEDRRVTGYLRALDACGGRLPKEDRGRLLATGSPLIASALAAIPLEDDFLRPDERG